MKDFKRVKENSMLFGVCTGLQDYTGIPTIVWRLLFLFGGFGGIYFLIAIFTKKNS